MLKKTYAIGDVKTKSSRYPIKKIAELCGPHAGDWCAMQTTLDDGTKVTAIGHRRGGEVHTFVATCGLTIAGKSQAHREDMSVYGNMEPRKCPQVLNWWTQMQPKIDKNNRFRQNILAIEERFVTQSFPFRLLTTIIGITFANAMEWYGYFIASKTYDDDFIAFMRELSYDAMHNKIDEPCAAERSPTRAARRPAGDTSPIRMSPRQVACTHKLASIRVLGNYKGYRKQLCAVCHDNKHKTTFCCAFCSTPERVFALHPPTVSYRGETVTYSCLEDHLADPTNADHQKNRVCVSGRKRGRCRRPEDDEEVDGSDDEDE